MKDKKHRWTWHHPYHDRENHPLLRPVSYPTQDLEARLIHAPVKTSSGGGSSSSSRSGCGLRALRRSTISSSLSSPSPSWRFLSTVKPPARDSFRPLPVFHTQSLLFLFGFLFFPCWWIGGFWLAPGKTKKKSKHNDVLPLAAKSPACSYRPVHSSLIANGRVFRRWLVMPLHQPSASTIDPAVQEQETYRRWNRYMSFVSLFLLAIVIAMLIWYQYGIGYHWWPAVL